MDTKQAPPIMATAWKNGLKVAEDTEPVEGGGRRPARAAALGICLAFFATMLGLQQIDTPLWIAEVSFAVALPIFSYGFLMDYIKSSYPPLKAMFAVASIIETSTGSVAIAIGVFAVMAHFGLLFLSIITSVIVAFLGVVGGWTIFIIDEVRKDKEKRKSI